MVWERGQAKARPARADQSCCSLQLFPGAVPNWVHVPSTHTHRVQWDGRAIQKSFLRRCPLGGEVGRFPPAVLVSMRSRQSVPRAGPGSLGSQRWLREYELCLFLMGEGPTGPIWLECGHISEQGIEQRSNSGGVEERARVPRGTSLQPQQSTHCRSRGLAYAQAIPSPGGLSPSQLHLQEHSLSF